MEKGLLNSRRFIMVNKFINSLNPFTNLFLLPALIDCRGPVELDKFNTIQYKLAEANDWIYSKKKKYILDVPQK